LNLGAILCEGIRSKVGHLPANKITAVLGDEHFDVVGTFGGLDVDGELGEAGGADLLGSAHGDLNVRTEGVEIA
jgi:hypothetical protein